MPGGRLPYRKDGRLGVKKAVLVPLRVASLKKATAGAFVVPFRVLKNVTDKCVVLELYFLGVKNFKSCTKQDLGTCTS